VGAVIVVVVVPAPALVVPVILVVAPATPAVIIFIAPPGTPIVIVIVPSSAAAVPIPDVFVLAPPRPPVIVVIAPPRAAIVIVVAAARPAVINGEFGARVPWLRRLRRGRWRCLRRRIGPLVGHEHVPARRALHPAGRDAVGEAQLPPAFRASDDRHPADSVVLACLRADG